VHWRKKERERVSERQEWVRVCVCENKYVKTTAAAAAPAAVNVGRLQAGMQK